MTETEWLACKDAREMILSNHLNPSARKLRLFAVAACRCSRQLILDPDQRRDVDLAERFADGLASKEELTEAYERANDRACRLNVRGMREREIRRSAEATAVANAVSPSGDPASDTVWQIRRAAHRDVDGEMAKLLRDIFGNPFRRIERDPVWLAHLRAKFGEITNHLSGVFNLAWLTATVVDLARAIYDERAFDQMPILADALMDAGCDDEAIITHCRSGGPHVRGCWAVDLLLAKS